LACSQPLTATILQSPDRPAADSHLRHSPRCGIALFKTHQVSARVEFCPSPFRWTLATQQALADVMPAATLQVAATLDKGER
jgi:hypothetical protein